MRLPQCVTNPTLVALIQGGGFPSLERFAQVVNVRGWQLQGIKLSYDHVSVRRWLTGGACQNPDVVAAVLSEAWGVPVPVQVIWPELRDGKGPAPAHLQAWVAARTLEDLAAFVGSDMLTRREVLSSSVGVATGTGLVGPIARWLDSEPAPLIGGVGGERVGLVDVERIEQATGHFMANDAAAGGGVCREAAVGQLKYAVDLARHGSYREAVGDRLMAAIADLAGWVGWMSHDLAMAGPAQHYLLYGLQAARESRDERAQLRAIGLLADLARQAEALGHPDTGLRLVDLASDALPSDGRKLNKIRSLLWSLRAQMLAGMGHRYLPEVRSAIGLSFELYGQISDEDRAPAVTACFPYTSDAELASSAATCYRRLSTEDPGLAGSAVAQALHALSRRPQGFARARMFDQIELTRARFLAGEPDHAASDGETALGMADRVSTSRRVAARLRELWRETEPYQAYGPVRTLRAGLREALSGSSVGGALRGSCKLPGRGRDGPPAPNR
jgi:hypothetical protein